MISRTMRIPPVPDNEKERLQALKSYHILDTDIEKEFERFTKLASLICETPISLITLLDEERQWFKSNLGLSVGETARELSFCQYTIMEPGFFEIEDAICDERFYQNPLVTGEPHIRFYAAYPLIDGEGYALGTLCVIDQKPRRLTMAQQRALYLLTEELVELIRQRREKQELENLEKLFRLSNDLICLARIDGFFKKLNPPFVSLLGWDLDYLQTHSFFEFIHPDDIAITENEIAKLAAGEQTINFVHRFRCKNGSYKVLQWVASSEPETGYLFAIARDITAEKNKELQLIASENKFRSFFEYSQGLMCTHDSNGRFLTINTAGASLLGYTTEEILQMTLYDIVPPKFHTNISDYLKDVFSTGTSKGLMTTLHKNGSLRVWLYNNTIEKNIDGSMYVIGNSIDITDRMRLETDLIRTKEILEQTNQVANVGGWEYMIDTGKIYWSPVTKIIHGVPEDYDPVLETALGFYKEGDSRETIVRAINNAIENGEGWDLELQIVTMAGEEKWVKAQGKAEMEKGKCKRLFGAFLDIDEQKKTKLALEANEIKYHAFFDISPVGIAINRHIDGAFIDGNQALYRMIGYTEEEYRQLTHSDVTPSRYDADELKHRESLTKTGRYGPYEKEYIHKDGHLVPVLLNGIKFIGNNGEEQVYSVIQDISESKKAEKQLIIEKSRLAAFVENAPAAVAMLDESFRYIAISNRWLEEYKLEGRDLIGLSHYEVFPNVSQNWKDIHQRCLSGAIEKNEEDIWRPPGWDHDQYLRWEVRPWYHFDNTIGGIMMFTQDITEICLHREELKTAKKQAEQASLAKSEFLASMSHEIRTPLNGVIGFTDLILKTRLDETQQQYMSIVNHSANALLSIVNDILDFSKIEAGKLELEIEKCDLYEIGSQAADIISYQVKKKDLEMLLNISTELPRFIWADSVRLKQVLINLLSNASKFTEKGEIELKVEALSDSTQKEVDFRFEVRDTGIGIRLETQQKIFQAFSQEDGSVTRKYGGTGLGLTISNKLLALMGSKLQLESSPGKGSRFFFDIRLTTEQGQLSRWEDISLIKKVLIVDDNENNRTILTQMLMLEHIHADVARNGIEALQILETGKTYDVILMDYNMPIMDGLETISKIRKNFTENGREQKIILLSSSSDDQQVIRKCNEMNVHIRLVKPIKMQDMYRALSRIAQRKEKYFSNEEEAQMHTHLEPVKVLIAEDGEVNMMLAKIIIKRIAPNATILEAQNGLEALEIYKKDKPDIIFMDIQMPEMNGYEATQMIRQLQTGKRVPIVAITAGTVKGEREKCIAAGMDDFISKPIVENAVLNVFHKWFEVSETTSSPAIIVSEESETIRHVNFDKLREIVGDDPTALKGFLMIIKQEIARSLQDLEERYGKKDIVALHKAGHKLKGTTLSAGLDKLSGIAIDFDNLRVYDETHIGRLMNEARTETDIIRKIIDKTLLD